MKTLYLLPAASVVWLISSAAIAQTTVSYTSPIADYQPFVDEKVTSWKASNDKVGLIGGWRAYAKEAQQPDNTPTQAPMQKTMGSNGEAMTTEPKTGQKQ